MRGFLENLPVEESARLLLGSHLVTPECRVQIVETEAYANTDDPGSHAYRGQTRRNQAMFGKPGTLYMYLAYGNHWMANVVCSPPGVASAVLLRAAKPLYGVGHMTDLRPKAKDTKDLLSGPGKLCAALGLDSQHYGLDLLDPASPVRLEPGSRAIAILTTVRVGLAPGKGDDALWRFVDADHLAWASRPHPKKA